MFKKYGYKRIFAAILAVSLLAGPVGVFAVQDQNNQNTKKEQPTDYTKRFFKWLFVGNSETIKKIDQLQKEVQNRKEKCENEIQEVTLNPNQKNHTNTKKLEKQVQELRRREASVIYKLFTTPLNNYLKPTVEKTNYWNRTIVAVKNIIPAVGFGLIGKLLGTFAKPFLKQKLIPENSRFSKAIWISQWIAYGLTAVYAVRTARAPFVAIKENLELKSLQTDNSTQKNIKIKEVKFNENDVAPTYVEKVQDV